MNAQQFERLVKKKAGEIRQYAQNRFPVEAGNTALRFVEGNFRAQGWQGRTFKNWKPNKRRGRILVKTGHLRSATYYVTRPGEVIVRNTVPYAKIHNEGGTVNTSARVRAHTRKAHTRGGRAVRAHQVQEHTRHVNFTMPQRQFAPTAGSPSPVLAKAVARKIEQELKRMFNT